MRRFTIIIPTHNHGRLLLIAARSVLRQTIPDFELMIIGDGVTEETRAAIEEVRAMDDRVRVFEFPKSPRTGENYRHQLLQEATGDAVCYLSDDDIWLPNHLTVFDEALKRLDVAHSRPSWVTPEGQIVSCLADWMVPEWRRTALGSSNPITLSFAGHTMGFYRRLPHGWQTAPKGRATDSYMWEQMLAVGGVRAGCTWQHTVIGFPSSSRMDWSLERREKELLMWEARVIGESEKLIQEIQSWLARSSYYGQQELEKWEQRKSAMPKAARWVLRLRKRR